MTNQAMDIVINAGGPPGELLTEVDAEFEAETPEKVDTPEVPRPVGNALNAGGPPTWLLSELSGDTGGQEKTEVALVADPPSD